MSDSLKSQAVKGVLWSAVERFSVQGVQFILSIIIARLIAPSEYGLIAMLGIFLAIAQTFIDSGFSSALIQKKDRTETDFSTVFYFNIIIALIVYLILYTSAPYISVFYREPQLEIVTRWIGLSIIISAFSIVQRAKLTIKLNFKTQAKASLIAVTVSGALGVYFAYYGYGVWALVIQSLANNLLNTSLLWLFSKWIPKFIFSWLSFRVLFSFGSKLLLSGLLHTIYLNLYSLVIGRKYSATDVGYYNRAYSLAQFPSLSIMNILTRVIYPMQCNIQDDEERTRLFFLQYLRLSAYILFPFLIILAAVSDKFILFFLSEAWLPSAQLLAILCIAHIWYPLLMVNGSVLNSLGRSDLVLKAEIIKKILAVLILCITLPFGLKIICIGFFLYNFIDYCIMSFYVRKLILTKFTSQIKILYPVFMLSFLIIMVVMAIHAIVKSIGLNLLLSVLGGFFSYILFSFLFKMEEAKFIKKLFIKNK